MKTEIKDRWLEALRSGEYKQGKGRLVKETDDGTFNYCCLGVLCDLAQQQGIVEQGEVPCGCGGEDSCSIECVGFVGANGSPDGKNRAFSFSVLPFPVMEWAGLDAADPMVRIEEVDGYLNDRHLSGLNDAGSDFLEIADLIEGSL